MPFLGKNKWNFRCSVDIKVSFHFVVTQQSIIFEENTVIYGETWRRGGHQHLQIGRMLDIDLISEPPPLPPDVCIQSVGICVARGAGSDSSLAGVSGCHIFVPVPHAPPPKGIHVGQGSKIVILPTTDLAKAMSLQTVSVALQETVMDQATSSGMCRNIT
jgi:hypothetical protein